MSRLSIIIPALAGGTPLEETLISVLENRPEGCEVVLACDPSYDDPYELGDEIEFAIVDQQDNWMHAANVGLQHTTSEFVHLMLPGMRATSGWFDAAVDTLESEGDTTAAIVPRVVFDASEPECCGLGFTPGGRLIDVSNRDLAQRRVAVHAAFPGSGVYRQDDLLRIGGWEESIHPRLATIEMMTRFYSLGKSAIFDGSCTLVADSLGQLNGMLNGDASHFMLARDVERLYLKCRMLGCSKSSAHFGTILQGVARSIPSGTVFSEVAGRLVGRFGAKRNAAPDRNRRAA